MYQPAAHKVDDAARLHDFIRANPLGLFITHGRGGLIANPVPFVLDASAGKSGVLRAHMARANPQWRDVLPANEALVVFQDPGLYITPSWYATKRDTGRVVPTWNYVCVQARGPWRAIEDRAWLRALVETLTDIHEGRRAAPWAVSDAPADFLDAQLAAIVGIEIEIADLHGKWKVSQNKTNDDRAGVIAGLNAESAEAAHAMAGRVESELRRRVSPDAD